MCDNVNYKISCFMFCWGASLRGGGYEVVPFDFFDFDKVNNIVSAAD